MWSKVLRKREEKKGRVGKRAERKEKRRKQTTKEGNITWDKRREGKEKVGITNEVEGSNGKQMVEKRKRITWKRWERYRRERKDE